jgi:hypothetical protein
MEEKSYHCIYMAKPIYGGWVTFTSHLSMGFNLPIYKPSKRSENQVRKFGYGTTYQNLTIESIIKMKHLLITAIDKHYYEYLEYFPENTMIVIHDPTELSGKNNKLIEYLDKFKVITIRESVQEYLKEKFKKDSIFLKHPFYQYSKPSYEKLNKCVSISRIDFDKHTDIILKSNLICDNKIIIYGAENRIYVHHKLKDIHFHEYWKGKFEKKYPILDKDGNDILGPAKYMIDLSIIKNDGGGSQYTFLEAIYNKCILILHNDWISQGDIFTHNVNCLGVSNENDIKHILDSDINYSHIIENSQKLLIDHISVDWSNIFL